MGPNVYTFEGNYLPIDAIRIEGIVVFLDRNCS